MQNDKEIWLFLRYAKQYKKVNQKKTLEKTIINMINSIFKEDSEHSI